MSSLTESTTLDEVLHDRNSGVVTVAWRDGVELDSARVARTKTYTADQAAEFADDVGPEASNYATLFQGD